MFEILTTARWSRAEIDQSDAGAAAGRRSTRNDGLVLGAVVEGRIRTLAIHEVW